jgi:hypothetical protein
MDNERGSHRLVAYKGVAVNQEGPVALKTEEVAYYDDYGEVAYTQEEYVPMSQPDQYMPCVRIEDSTWPSGTSSRPSGTLRLEDNTQACMNKIAVVELS